MILFFKKLNLKGPSKLSFWEALGPPPFPPHGRPPNKLHQKSRYREKERRRRKSVVVLNDAAKGRREVKERKEGGRPVIAFILSLSRAQKREREREAKLQLGEGGMES